MDLPQLDSCFEISQSETQNLDSSLTVSLEAEIPEALYIGMKDFVGANPNWDQYRVMTSALASFLFQNGCSDRAVTERYLNDLFVSVEA